MSGSVLRILRNDVDAHRVFLVLQGHIAGEWAALLERECEELTRSGLQVALDLSGVIFIGRSGLEVLGRLGLAGVGIFDCPPLIADMLEQEGIAVVRNDERTNHEEPPGTRGGSADE